MNEKPEKKEYSRPEVRQIRLSLSEVTLGTGCWAANPGVDEPLCGPGTPCLG